jgi:hypothetical protein
MANDSPKVSTLYECSKHGAQVVVHIKAWEVRCGVCEKRCKATQTMTPDEGRDYFEKRAREKR